MKKENKDTAKVIFRKYKRGVGKGEIIALFPFIEWSDGICTSYMHIGQHSGADYQHVMSLTEPATEAEYKPLYDELVRIGYGDMQIMKRRPRKQ